jgi:hypothetical protein
VGQRQKKPILHVLRKQKCPFLRARGAEIKRLTGERPEILILAFRVGALDAGDTLGVVPAENELLHRLGDSLESETAIDDRVLVFVLIGEVMKVFFEEKLDDTDSPLSVD